MASTPIEIPIKLNGLAAIKSELRELKGELANATDPKQMQELAQKAGELKDQLADANEQVAVFASGSKFEQVSNSFGSMKDSLMSLDFEEAAQKAKMFQQTLGSISPATIGNSIKGLISVVGSLSKAFVQFGVALLANPIFLLVAAIVAIVAIIGVVMNKLGILKPVLNAIGKAFEFIGDIIDVVIQGLKDFTDWLGITNNAAEDAADKQAAAAEKTATAYEEKSKSVVGGLDREIELAKLDGKNTVELEKKKQYWIIKTAEARLQAIKEKIIAGKLSGDLDSEEIAELKKAYTAQVEVVKDAKHQVEVIDKTEANRKKDDRKKEEEDDKKSAQDAASRAQEAYKARIAAEKQFRADRLAAIRSIEDAEFELLAEGQFKEQEANRIKYERLIADTLANEKLLADERDKLVFNLKQQKLQKELAIDKQYNDEKIAADKLLEEARILSQKEAAEKLNEDKKAAAAESLKIAQDFAKAEVDARIQMQSALLGIADGTVALLNTVAGKSKALAITALAIEKGAAIANVVINAAKEMSANAAAAALNPLNAVTGGAAGAAQLLKANIFTKIRAGLAIATIASTGISSAKSISSGGSTGGGGGASASGGGGNSSTSTQPATPQVNLFGANNNANTFGANGQSSNQGGEMVVKAVVVESDVTSMQKKMNKVQESAVL